MQASIAREADVERELTRIWSEVLRIPVSSIRAHDHFFSLGGDSLLITQVMSAVNARFFAERPDDALAITDFFTHGTLSSLAAHIASELEALHTPHAVAGSVEGSGIAIIGMACRFPGAPDIATFWRNLREGVESIRSLSENELREAGVDDADLKHPRYVRAAAFVEGVQLFDAGYFGLTPREAAILSPEQRLLLECSEDALQDAGYGARSGGDNIGVFVGTGVSSYLLEHLAVAPGALESADGMTVFAANTCAASRVAYLLDLTGPSITIDTACSSSLVAVHAACHALLSGECDMALAGGATVRRFGPRGYYAEEGGILSPDGHCRPFDRDARGTVSASGAGVVLLKRLSAAIADGDCIYAIIRGTAVNNDGGSKAAYPAPSVSGQANAIRRALAAAGVAPAEIQYIETHGTATALGDLIELAALREVFSQDDANGPACALGTLKANVGHLEAAAGIAGLIKVALALKHREMPPAIHFRNPAQAIGLDKSRFTLSSNLSEWPAGSTPRRAGVSSFGVGGTNAHAILEEPAAVTPSASDRPTQLLVVSAQSQSALRESCRQLARRLATDRDLTVADVGYTLQMGRAAYRFRDFVVVRTKDEAVRELELHSRSETSPAPISSGGAPAVVFMFPGEGCQYSGMLEGIYQSERVFRDHFDRCSQTLQPRIGRDLRDLLSAPAETLARAEWCQPVLFALEYSLARLWISWGIAPSLMIGQGVGEYVAAVIAGVFTVEDALTIVAMRGRLAWRMSQGEAPTTGSVVEEFARCLRGVSWGEVRVPFISSVTGATVAGAAAASPEYWIAQFRETPDVLTGLQAAVAGEARIFLEIGPGDRLSRLVRALSTARDHTIVASAGCTSEIADDASVLMYAVGQLWQRGVSIHWQAFNGDGRRRRVSLPTYPFERQHHWIARPPSPEIRREPASGVRAPIADWFHVPVWKEQPRLPTCVSARAQCNAGPRTCYLLIEGDAELEHRLADRLAARSVRLIRVSLGDRFACDEDRYTIVPEDEDGFARVLTSIEERGLAVTSVIHAAELAASPEPLQMPDDGRLQRGVYGVIDLCKALAGQRHRPVTLVLVTRSAHAITAEEECDPCRAMLASVAEVISKEFPEIHCRSIDFAGAAGRNGVQAAWLDPLIEEILAPAEDSLVVFRGSRRWVRRLDKLPLQPSPDPPLLRERGVYLVTGGLGGIGWTIAEFLGRTLQARLVLIGRQAFPDRSAWSHLLETRESADALCQRIRAIRELESAGAQVSVFSADVSCSGDLERVISHVRSRFGRLHGVIHAAGVAGGGTIFLKTRETAARVMAPKVAGTWLLHQACKNLQPDFFLCCSSLASVVAPAGQYDYCAANAYQDAFCRALDGRTNTRFIAIDWDAWRTVGMAVNTAASAHRKERRAQELIAGISCEEGVEVFKRVLANPLPQWIINARGLLRTGHGALNREETGHANGSVGRDEEASIRDAVSGIWKELLGVDAREADDDFFALGGDSLLAVQLRTRLEKRFSRPVSLRALLHQSTLAGMVRLVEMAQKE